jgi:hypothetical protein
MFFGNSLGLLSGGAFAAAFGLRWVFLLTAVLLANLFRVYQRCPNTSTKGTEHARTAELNSEPSKARTASGRRSFDLALLREPTNYRE